MKKRAIIVDLNSILYRFYFKLPGMRSSKGFPTGALYGLANTLISLKDKFAPDYFVAALDSKRKDLNRKKIYDDYKINRKKAPSDLSVQISKAYELLEGFGLTFLSKSGYEADDVIASYVEYFNKQGIETFVMTSDKDMMQLVPKASIIKSDFTIISSPEDVKKSLGVLPEKVADLFALQGDSSDGIPGVKGVGPKSAVNLLEKYGSIENIEENIDELKGALKSKISENRELMKISKKLATLEYFDVDRVEEYSGFGNIEKIFEELEFRSMYKKIGLEKQVDDIESIEVRELLLNSRSRILFINGFYYMVSNGKVLFSKILKDSGNIIDTYDAKSIYKEIDINLGLDTMIAYHLIFNEERATLERAIKRVFGVELSTKEDNSAMKAYYADKLVEFCQSEMDKNELESVYEYIEKPLIPILAKMEKHGVSVDKSYLSEYEKLVTDKLDILKRNIEEEAGLSFNIASPKQLSQVLFEKMGLTPLKKTKTGFSTDNEVLEHLSDHKIAKYLLEYRKFSKLLSTYILPLQKDRVFTSYNQTGTITGRLSSSNPNLQNIPSRTEEGLLIRKAFRSSKNKLLVLDYSQIELRILASMSQDESLLKAYNEGLDLHELTAKKIFGISNKENRYRAKIINFSLIYGKSAFGLAKELGMGIVEASEYIERYFREYRGVKKFIDQTIYGAKVEGYVRTLFGRKRVLPEINSGNRNLRSAAERAAVNTVIQGTQSEIIKRAMVDIDRFISDKDINMVLQVHDELVLEVEDSQFVEEIKSIMERAVKLEGVKIKVNSYLVDNWADAK